MRFQGAWLYWEFQQHMAANHGSNWSVQLTKLQSQLRPNIQQLPRKGQGPTGQQGGKANKVKKSKARKKERTQSKRCQTNTNSFFEGNVFSSLPHLLRDANAGSSVLQNICNSVWWDWSRGSTLIFWQRPAGEQ
jgi:hypothetical protein